MKNLRSLLSIVICFGILVSCSTTDQVVNNSFIQKRKYNKGFFISKRSKASVASLEKQTSPDQKISESIAKVKANRGHDNPETTDNNALAATNNVPVIIAKPSSKKDEKPVVHSEKVVVPVITKEDIKTHNKILKQIGKSRKAVKKANGWNLSDDKILYIILAILIPWLAVGLVTDWDLEKVLINLLLCFLCYVPGVIHAIIIVNRNM